LGEGRDWGVDGRLISGEMGADPIQYRQPISLKGSRESEAWKKSLEGMVRESGGK
jgi:hypothetical protein